MAVDSQRSFVCACVYVLRYSCHDFSLKRKKIIITSLDPVVKISHFNAGGAGSIPGLGAKIPHALLPKTKTENKQYFNKFHKDS